MPAINFSPSEYRILLEMVNLSTYVATYHSRGGRGDWLEGIRAISNKVLAQAENMGWGELVEQEPATEHWVPTENLDSEEDSFARECLDDMLDRCFWEDLVCRLSDRDLARTMTAKQWDALREEEQTRRREENDQRYWQEFEQNGVNNLECIHRQPHG